MLTKEKLSKIAEQAIGMLHYTYAVSKVRSQNSYVIRLYDAISGELVANSFIYEGDKPGCFTFDFVPERSNKTDREVLRDINSRLFEYFNEQLEPKYYIRLLNTDYGYLTQVEGTGAWNVTSLKIAKMSNQKATFMADEINEMEISAVFANSALWNAAEEVEEKHHD